MDRQTRPGIEKLAPEAIKKLQFEIEAIRREQEQITAQLDYARKQSKARERTESVDFLKEQEDSSLSKEEVQADGRRFYYLLKGFATPEMVSTILQTHCLDNEGVPPSVTYIRSRYTKEPRYAIFTFVRQLDGNEPHPIAPEGAREAICLLEIKHLEPDQMEVAESEDAAAAAGSRSPSTSGEEQEVQP